MNRFLFIAVGLFLYASSAEAQEPIDSNLLKVVLHTLSNHKKIAPYITYEKGTAVEHYYKFEDSLKNLELDVKEDKASTVPMLMIYRHVRHWTKTLDIMGGERHGAILRKKDFELYYMPKEFFVWYTASPLVVQIDSITASDKLYDIEFRTTKAGWFSFPMKRTPKYFYAFKVRFKIKNGIWTVCRIKKNRLSRFAQNLMK